MLLPVIVLRLLHCFVSDMAGHGGLLHLGIGAGLARFLTDACCLNLRIRDVRWLQSPLELLFDVELPPLERLVIH